MSDKNNIKIIYDGAYPNLCSGTLIVTINNKVWHFPSHCLESGGTYWFDDDWNDYLETGLWTIEEWPSNFPKNQKKAVIDAVNKEIPHGCCGGCI